MIKNIMNHYTGVLIGFIIACILITYYSIPIKNGQIRTSLFSIITITSTAGVLIGGIISGYIIENYFCHIFLRKGQRWGGIIGSILISPSSLFYATITGTLGLGMGFTLFSLHVIGKCLPLIGLFSTIVAVIVICESIGFLIGSVVGLFVQNIFHKIF